MLDISFIIPIYNTPIHKIENCINSIIQLRDRFNIEIIVIDDGSESFIKDFFHQHFKEDVSYYFKNNGGVSSARNLGLKLANGRYVSFVDADDIIIPSAFQNELLLSKYDLVLFDLNVQENLKFSTWKVLDASIGKVTRNAIINELILSNRMNSPCAKLFLNSIIKENNLTFDENMVTGEDMNFVIDFVEISSNYYYSGISSYIYEREEVSRVSRIENYPDTYLKNIIFLYNKSIDLVKKYNLSPEYFEILNIDHVEGLYNYISDLITLNICTSDMMYLIVDHIKRLSIDRSKVSKKKLIKYDLLINEKWVLIKIIAYIRKLYLKIK